MTRPPLFTAIVHTYNRPALLRKAVEAIQRQTYANLEIILINNGAVPQAVEYLHEVASADSRVKLVHFSENQFSWDEPGKYIRVCWNAALAEAAGEYVWIQEDDDLIADDYVEKMVALFQGNPECTTAAGLPVSIDIDGRINETQIEGRNIRPRYTQGHELALDHLMGTRTMYAAPGTIFTIKRDVLLEAGGYHRSAETSHIYGIVPFGVTGFDPAALFYWRHHDGQANKQLTAYGLIGIEESMALLKDWRLEQRWGVFGTDLATKVIRSYKRDICDHAAKWTVTNLYAFRHMPAFRIVRKMWFRPYFWRRIIVHATARKYYAHAIGPMLKSPLKRVFRTWPALAKLTPALGRLSEKAERWN